MPKHERLKLTPQQPLVMFAISAVIRFKTPMHETENKLKTSPQTRSNCSQKDVLRPCRSFKSAR